MGTTNTLLLYSLILCNGVACTDNNLKVIKELDELHFNFPSESLRQKALKDGSYIPGNSMPIDIDVDYTNDRRRIFITIPRYVDGVPITLGVLNDNGTISGYPSYSWNNQHNCKGITSVFRTMIDICGRLWVMDTGKIVQNQVCPPQLLAFDLTTDKVIYKQIVPQSVSAFESLFVTPVVDVKEGPSRNCSDTFVYVADTKGFAILVVDVANGESWWITHRYFYPHPPYGEFQIGGVTFTDMGGIFGMALTTYKPDRDRILYFHAFAAVTENYVRTSSLKNNSLISNSRKSTLEDYSDLIKVLPGRRRTQTSTEAIDENDIMYFGITSPPSIYCWNTKTDFSQRNFHPVSINNKTLQYTSGVKVINAKSGQELWVFTQSFQTSGNDTTKYRILTGKISTLNNCGE